MENHKILKKIRYYKINKKVIFYITYTVSAIIKKTLQ